MLSSVRDSQTSSLIVGINVVFPVMEIIHQHFKDFRVHFCEMAVLRWCVYLVMSVGNWTLVVIGHYCYTQLVDSLNHAHVNMQFRQRASQWLHVNNVLLYYYSNIMLTYLVMSVGNWTVVVIGHYWYT